MELWLDILNLNTKMDFFFLCVLGTQRELVNELSYEGAGLLSPNE